jgi:hypothetical protein
MLSGTDGRNSSSTENASGDKPSAGRSLEVTLANKSASELFNLGIEFILKVENLVMGGITKVGYTFVTIRSPKFRKTNFRPN